MDQPVPRRRLVPSVEMPDGGAVPEPLPAIVPKRGKKAPESLADVAVSSIYQKAMATAAKKAGAGQLQLTRRVAVAHHLGIPSPSLAFSYGLGSNVLPLSRFAHLVGKEASFKTAFLVELFRWVFEVDESRVDAGVPLMPGSGRYCENENKLAADYVWSILEHRQRYEELIGLTQSRTADEWMTAFLSQVKDWEAIYKDVGWFTALILAVDSLVGTAPAGQIDNILKKGDIDMGFPALAKKLTMFSQLLPQMIGLRPILVVATNHLKEFTDARTGMTLEKVPGGQAIKHMESLEFRFQRVKSIDHPTLPGAIVKIRFHKNCFGDSRRAIEVPIRWTYDIDDDGQKRQWTMWDWPVASIDLLVAFQQKKPELWAKIQEVLDLHVSSGRVWSDALGIPSSSKVTKHEAGVILEESPEILDRILPLMGIRCGRFYQPGMDYAAELGREDAQPDGMAARVWRRPAAGNLSAALTGEDSEFGGAHGVDFDASEYVG